jgi:hypothetical protein
MRGGLGKALTPQGGGPRDAITQGPIFLLSGIVRCSLK